MANCLGKWWKRYCGAAKGSTLKVLSQVTLADGSRFNFDYTSWGQVNKISNYAADNHLLNYRSYNLPPEEPIVRKYIKMREDYLALGGEAFWLEVGAVIGIMTAVFEGEALAAAGGALLPINVHYQQRARLNQINSDYTREVAETCGPEVPKPVSP